MLIYAASALTLLARGMGVGALIVGNSAQWIGHLLILMVLARGLVRVRGARLIEALLKALLASTVMAAVVWWAAGALEARVGQVAQLVLAGALGLVAYVGLCALLRVEALDFFIAAVARRLQRARH